MNQFLGNILDKAEGALQSIIIFDLNSALPLHYSSNDPKLHYILFGDNDIGKALVDFENLKQVSKALDSFGKTTSSGELNYSIFKLTQGQLMVYFHKLPDMTVAICFIALKEISLGRLVSLGRNNIQEIKDNMDKTHGR